MFSIFSSSSITTEKRFLFISFAIIISYKSFPHLEIWLSILVIHGRNDSLHLDTDIFRNVFNLLFDICSFGIPGRDSFLVCKNDNLVAIFVELSKFIRHGFIPVDPVSGILGEFGTTLGVDQGAVHVEAGNFLTGVWGRLSNDATVNILPCPI